MKQEFNPGIGGLVLPSRFKRAYTKDQMMTFDQNTIDSAGAFLVGELERLDQTLHMPLADVTYTRDIDMREDVSIADEITSFTNSSFAAAGGPSPTGKSWIGKDASVIAGLGLDIGKTPNPLSLWGMQLGWTLPELASAEKVGRPVDAQKFAAMQLKWNMDADEQVYIGDPVINVKGLLNNAAVTVNNAVNGNWTSATPAQILADVNTALNTAWANSGYAVCPDTMLLPPVKWSLLVATLVSTAGNISTLEYLKLNSISNSLNGKPLNILPCKWNYQRGVSNADRMVVYTKRKDRIRFPMVPLQRTPLEYRDIRQLTTYYGRLGVVEVVYPETLNYVDGI